MNNVKEISLKEYRKVLKREPSNFFQKSYVKLQLGKELNNTGQTHTF